MMATPRLADDPTDWPLWRRVAEYANAVGRYGPDSEQAREVLGRHADAAEFLELADAVDCLKRAFGGSGIDWPVDEWRDGRKRED